MFNPKCSLMSRMMGYNATFGDKYPGSALFLSNGMLHGTWFLGNNYRGNGFYGSYPPQYLKRWETLFPDTPNKLLHLFSGHLPKSKAYTRFDLVQKADIKGNAEELAKHFDEDELDVIYADPPYSKEAAVKYGVKMPNRHRVMDQCYTVLRPGGFVIWLDTVWPMVAKTKLKLVGAVGIFRSSNHVIRGSMLWQKPLHG